jgi:hypothetical protein
MEGVMKRSRRDFLLASSIGATGAALGCGKSSPAGSNPTTSPFSAVLQFSGLVMHGSWPASDPSKPTVLSGWDALLVRDKDGFHKPSLRIPFANVADPSLFQQDPYLLGFGVRDITNTDVVVHIGGVARGPVTAVTGTRKSGAPCPNPQNASEFSDIAWLADFNVLLRTIPNKGAITDALKADATGVQKDKLLTARVRLSTGQVACSRPSEKPIEKLRVDFATLSPGQFCADLVRYTSAPSDQIVLDLLPFGGGPGTQIKLVPTGPSPVSVLVENHDPDLAERVLNGVVTKDNFFRFHFEPHFQLLKALGQFSGLTVSPTCCDTACDPPFYCFETRGYFP